MGIFSDKRFSGFCVFCGGLPETHDHVPSKVFLDDPLPGNLPTVHACKKCNNGFSLDEEYVACFLESVLSGSADPTKVSRQKIQNSLRTNPDLSKRIQESMRTEPDGTLMWLPEFDRVKNVVVKLARGHSAYELSLPQIEEPTDFSFQPLMLMSDEERDSFESAGIVPGASRGWPEVGSRAFIRECEHPTENPWIEIQPGRYRYAVDQRCGTCVQIADSPLDCCN